MAPSGRPRQFNPTDALHAAMLVFWSRGFLGASMDDLTAAMGINRASLYAAFGDKERLFLAAVDRYLTTHGTVPRSALEAPRVTDAVRGFFRAVIENSTGEDTPPGCLVACVLVGAAAETPAIRGKLKDCLDITDGMVKARLDRAVLDGELREGVDTNLLARLANSLRHGLTLRARAGESRDTLLATVDDAATIVLGSALIAPVA